MNDNFDSNVANRKPLTKKHRPAHPWDVPVANPNPEKDASPVDSPAAHSLVDDDVDRPAANAKKPQRKKGPPHPAPAAVAHAKTPDVPSKDRGEPNGLSDTININSNYCKLHNDVSDHLLRLLSASAQSVYIRLYRQSYGWNRNWAAESLPKLTAACKLSLQTVRKAIKELENLGCLKKQFSDYHKATVYRVYLPSEIGIGTITPSNTTISHIRGLINVSQDAAGAPTSGQGTVIQDSADLSADTDVNYDPDIKILEGDNAFSGGQEIDIQSRYSLGTSIYNLLKQGGALPKNIFTNMTNIQLMGAVDIIDEFYDSIGFSVVSRSQYRKSVIDYFEMIKSGFSADDIRYAVRWTFKNSRSRPESFSLIKHTMHLAMNDLIKDLKNVAGEKDLARKKQEALKKTAGESVDRSARQPLDPKDVEAWNTVVEDLRETVNEHSFAAFIEPLRLVGANDGRIVVNAPPDSLTWVADHFADLIAESYREKSGTDVVVEVV